MKMNRKLNFWLTIVIILSLIIRLWISWLPIPLLVEKIMVDDTFYGFSVSKNIAYENGITYDGKDPSNGIQPLWLFAIAPFFLLTGDINLAVNLILTFATIIDVLTLILIFKFAKMLFDDKIALVAAAFYGLNPLIIFQTLSGIDVILSVFFVMLTLFFYLRNKDNLNFKNNVMLGIFLGLAVLTRMDNIFLFAVIILHILFKNKTKVVFKNIITIVLVAFLLALPWFLWSFLTFGTIFPSSGIARYNLNHGITPFFDYSSKSNLELTAENLYRSLGIIYHQLGVVNFNFNSIAVLPPIFLTIVLIFSLKNVRKLNIIIAYGAFLYVFYGFYFLGVQIRYFTPFMPAFLILLATGLYFLSNKIFKNKNMFYLISIIFLIIVLINGYQQWGDGYFKWQTPLYQDTIWLKENTKPNDIVASFNSGILSFFSERRVINLDGVVNYEVLSAIKNKSIINYMEKKNVSLWVDIAHFNQTVYDEVANGSLKIDVLRDSYYGNILGDGKEDLVLIYQSYGFYKHLRGFNMLSVFFKFKIKY